MTAKRACINFGTAALLSVAVAFCQGQGTGQPYKPGVTFQTTNPNYPTRNPFYFEGRVDWNLLKIDQPANAWEFAQRGIHKQDDLEDVAGAIEDYRTAISMNDLKKGTCKLVDTAPPNFGQAMPIPPCMFTVRTRLGRLLLETNPAEAKDLFMEVLAIDPLRLGIHALIAETYVAMDDLSSAIAEYQSELDLSPVNTKLTVDEANNAHVHWALAEIYHKLAKPDDEMKQLDMYLKATKWHSDTYAWRIQLAQKKMEKLKGSGDNGN